MHRANCEVSLSHFLSEPVDLAFRIAENNGLRDSQRVVKIAESVEFPLFTFDSHEELFDSLERKFITEIESLSLENSIHSRIVQLSYM